MTFVEIELWLSKKQCQDEKQKYERCLITVRRLFRQGHGKTYRSGKQRKGPIAAYIGDQQGRQKSG